MTGPTCLSRAPAGRMLGPPFVRPDDPTGVVIAQPACVGHGLAMARNTAKLFLQRLRYPVADRPVLGTGHLAHSPDQTLGQLDGENVFGLRNGHGSRLLLGGLHVASRLAG